MDLFQILILLFILYPLLQKLFGGGKKPANKRQTDQTATGQHQGRLDRETARSSGSDSWDDALRELESIFTGQTTSRAPAPEPEPAKPQNTLPTTRSKTTGGGQPVRKGSPVPTESIQLKRQRELQERFEKTQKSESLFDEIIDEDNPIYQSLDEGAIVEDEDNDYSEDTRKYLGLDNPRELQRHFVVKEILDKPLSRRPGRHHMPF
jgi:hypothetical protein